MRLRQRFVLTLVVIAAVLILPAAIGLRALSQLQVVAERLRSQGAEANLSLGRLQTALGELDSEEKIYVALAGQPDSSRLPPRARIREKAQRLNLDLGKRMDKGELEVMWQPSTEQNVDALAQRLLDAVARTSASRLFIDGLDGFQRATMHPERVHHVFTAVANELRVRGVTTLYTFEVPKFIGPGLDTPVTGVSALAENLVYLRFVELRSHLYRLLSILKVRDSSYDSSLREFHITDHGIRLEKTFDSAEAILTGSAVAR